MPGIEAPSTEELRRRATEALAAVPAAGAGAGAGEGGSGGDAETVRSAVASALWTVADLARRLGVDPEAALRTEARAFAERVREVERRQAE